MRVSKILKCFSISVPSILLIVFPYFVIHWTEIYNSSFFKYEYLSLFILCLFPLQIAFYNLYTNKNEYLKYIGVSMLVAIIFFFYGINIVDVYFRLEKIYFHHQILRSRTLFVINFLLLIFFEVIILKKKKGFFLIQNIFFTVLFLVSLVAQLFSFNKYRVVENLQSLHNIHIQSDSSNKPILLIILDEYHSPTELAASTKNKSFLNFSNHLKESGWEVNNEFYSNEVSTIHSISSLFNFNLSKDAGFSDLNINALGVKKLIVSALNDSLTKKQIKIVNWGIFDFGSTKSLTRLYYFPENFLEQLLGFSSYPLMFYNTGGLNLDGLNPSYYSAEQHNKKLIKSLSSNIIIKETKNTFFYIHLFMPHKPMVFTPEFEYKADEFENYLAYWEFTNSKIKKIMDSLSITHKYRIILTGDHGYRNSFKVNPHHTFTAFWGFQKNDLDKIKSVQDIGYLINGYFN